MAEDSILPYSLDDYFQGTSIGSVEKAIGNNMFGINHMQTPGMVPTTKDTYGYVFFTRPQLNLQADNLRNFRKFYPLLTSSPVSSQMAIRCLLDPRIMTGYNFGQTKIPPIKCPIVDNTNPFIPMLTNNINTIAGWPDMVVPSFMSKPGLYNETWGQVDGVVENYENYDLTASFKNTKGSPILALFKYWELYSSLVFNGKFVPYPDFITNNRVDYNTRIYRLVMDQNKRIVNHICATGVAWPISNPTGGIFDFNNETVFNDQNKDLSVTFRALGFEWQDDILVYEFNKVITIFNPSMKDKTRATAMIKLTPAVKHLFNNRCYPRIDPYTSELEWWVPKEIYDARSKAFLQDNIGNIAQQDNDFTGG